MAESFCILSIPEFEDIRRDELEIFHQLRDRYNYINDEYGDVVIGKDGNFLIDAYNPPTPSIISVSGGNRFAHMINGRNICDLVSGHSVEGYSDVFGLDVSLMKQQPVGYSMQVLAFFLDDQYQGCTWIFTSVDHPQYVGIYGIRSSIVNTLHSVSGTARRMFKYIIDTYRSMGKTIVIPWPLYPVTILLSKLGFQEHNRTDSTPERQFLKPITSTINYYTF